MIADRGDIGMTAAGKLLLGGGRRARTAACVALLVCGTSDGVRAASEELVNLSDPAVPLATRIARAKALGTDKGPTALDVLLTGLDSRSEELRDAVRASLLAQKGDLVLLARAADPKKKSPERVAALAGLRLLRPAKVGARLGALLVDKDESVREAAAHALCVVGAAEAETALVTALTAEPSAKVRYFVAVALGSLKTTAAKQAIAARAKVEADFTVQDALTQAASLQARP
jgi:HEAT repeat protein